MEYGKMSDDELMKVYESRLEKVNEIRKNQGLGDEERLSVTRASRNNLIIETLSLDCVILRHRAAESIKSSAESLKY